MRYLKMLLLFAGLGLGVGSSSAQVRKTENLLLIGWDGVRWQEIFTGVDSGLMNDHSYTRGATAMKKLYWDDDPGIRRKKLFPFFWSTIQQQGQLYGNRLIGNKADVSNHYNLTGPGFTETLIGFADSAVSSNNLVTNKNTNVLEFINSQKAYKGKVAVFAMSTLFDSILAMGRGGLLLSCEPEKPVALPDREFRLLNDMQQLAPRPFGERPDLLTYFQAREYLTLYRPRVMYLEMGETDDYAHAGSYDFYISTLHSQEAMIAALWNYIQSIPQYKDKTTLLIACDHGRGGEIRSQWTGHGPHIKDSKDIFILGMGPDMPALGEVGVAGQLYQGQMAATIAEFLGLHYTAEHPILPAITTMFKK